MELHGVDISQGELAQALKRSPKSARFTRARAQQLPFISASFDAVLRHMALMLMSDHQGALKEVSRVLKSSGRFAAIVGADAPISDAQKFFIDCISGYARKEEYEDVSFRESNLRDPIVLRKLFLSHFANVSIDRIEVALLWSAQQAWDWFSSMYDLALRRIDSIQKVKARFLNLVGDNGLKHIVALQLIQATKH